MLGYCENCKHKETCKRSTGIIFGFCRIAFEPIRPELHTCRYTDKQCNHANESGECKQGQQNCGWEYWHVTDAEE